MVRREVLLRRLQKLDEYLQILRQLQHYSRDEFLASPERYGSAERFLPIGYRDVDRYRKSLDILFAFTHNNRQKADDIDRIS